jgi:hypothetical protein
LLVFYVTLLIELAGLSNGPAVLPVRCGCSSKAGRSAAPQEASDNAGFPGEAQLLGLVIDCL